MAISLTQIVPWGRSRREYELMFALSESEWAGGRLDCGGGPSSFTEVSEAGHFAMAVDPFYVLGASAIWRRFEATEESMIAQVRAAPRDWVWSFHRDPENLRANRPAATEGFLADYEVGPLAVPLFGHAFG